jgi:cell wall-associated NlpC family hydrolase
MTGIAAVGVASNGSPAIGADAMARMTSIRARFEGPQVTATPDTDDAGFSEVLSSTLGCDCCCSATASSNGSLSGTTGAGGESIVRSALQFLGVPYVWGGTDPRTGFDCSGFVQHVLGLSGIQAPRVSAQQATMGVPVASLAEARPGDLLAFGQPVDHIGIYLGNGQMIHAPHSGDVVSVDPIGNRNLTAIRRVTSSGTSAWPTSPTAVVGSVGAAGGSGTSVLPKAIVDKVRRFEPLFIQAGQRWGIDPALLAAQCQRESGGNTTAVSSAGALGLMQFMPATAAARGVDPLDPASAIDGAARYLAEMKASFGGSIELAIAAYAAGPGSVRRAGNAVPSQQVAKYIAQVLALAGGPR